MLGMREALLYLLDGSGLAKQIQGARRGGCVGRGRVIEVNAERTQ